MDKLLITMIVLWALFVSGWSINNYAQERWWVAQVEASEQVVDEESSWETVEEQQDSEGVNTQDDTYVPSAAPSWLCQGSSWWCGCGQ